MSIKQKVFNTSCDGSIMLIRLMAGAIFLSEGVHKFLSPAIRGPGRFEGTGFPNPEFWADFAGVFESPCGLLLLLGLLMRPAALAMIVNMLVAIVLTKIPIAFDESFGPFVLRELNARKL